MVSRSIALSHCVVSRSIALSHCVVSSSIALSHCVVSRSIALSHCVVSRSIALSHCVVSRSIALSHCVVSRSIALSHCVVYILSFYHPLYSCYSIPLMWTLLIVMLVLFRLAYEFSFAAIYTFINNSVTPDKLGSFNGLAASLTAFSR